ncbi:MAG TPA: hypothetical protein VNO17_10425 [Actinomycetota bacterium]|nr:hypothetical protein [Actinomycetota bacterium]
MLVDREEIEAEWRTPSFDLRRDGLSTHSRSGAVDLSLRAGMRIERGYVRYEKELIPRAPGASPAP